MLIPSPDIEFIHIGLEIEQIQHDKKVSSKDWSCCGSRVSGLGTPDKLKVFEGLNKYRPD